MAGDAQLLAFIDGDLPQIKKVRVSSTDMGGDGAVEKGVFPAPSPVDKLIGYHKISRLNVGLEAAGRAGADDPAYTLLPHGPQIGPVINLVGRNAVGFAVAGQEGHPFAFNDSQGTPVTW